MVDQIFWPQNEVNRFLKGRSTAFSFHEAWELRALVEEFPETKMESDIWNRVRLSQQPANKGRCERWKIRAKGFMKLRLRSIPGAAVCFFLG